MQRTYDIFEKLPDGTMLWRASVEGHEPAISQLKEASQSNSNEFQLIHLPTKAIIAIVNVEDRQNRRVILLE